MSNTDTLMTTQPKPSKGLPAGFFIVEEPGGWSVVDDEDELVITARNYKDLRDRLKEILDSTADESELQMVRYFLKNKAKS